MYWFSCLSAGPFISVLFSRLENMLENSMEVNLLVTGILAQLAAYPQPLLRCFLLNTQAAFQPSVRSLYQVSMFFNQTSLMLHTACICVDMHMFVFQVLDSVGCQIEQHAASRPEFAQMVQDAAQYLLLRDDVLKDRGEHVFCAWFV